MRELQSTEKRTERRIYHVRDADGNRADVPVTEEVDDSAVAMVTRTVDGRDLARQDLEEVDRWLAHVKESAGGWPGNAEDWLRRHLAAWQVGETVAAAMARAIAEAADREKPGSHPRTYRHALPVLWSAQAALEGRSDETVRARFYDARPKAVRVVRVNGNRFPVPGGA